MSTDNTDFLEEMFSAHASTQNLDDSDKFDPEDDIETSAEEGDTQDTSGDSTANIEGDEEDSVIENYVNFLAENNLIEIPEGIDLKADPDKLQEVFEYTKKARNAKAIETVFDRLPEDFKPLFDYALRGGTSLDNYLKVFNNDLQNISLETPEGQKQVLFQYYKETSPYTDEKIQRLISHFNDDDELKLEAEDAYNQLMEDRNKQKVELLQQTQAQTEAYQQELEQKTVSLNKAIEETNSIHPTRKNKVKAFFFEPVQSNNTVTTGFNATINSILSNPEHQAQLADILLDYSTEGGFTTDRLERRVKSKATQDFKTLVKSKIDPKQAQRSSTSKAPTNSSFDWEEYQNSLNKHA